MTPRQRRRIRLENGIYHVYTRGVVRQPIFLTDDDRWYYLELLEKSVDRYGIRIGCQTMMDNHVHLAIRTPKPNISEAMQMLFSAYARYFNRTYERRGHVMEDRFFSPLVEPGYPLFKLSAYIHRNPVAARMVPRAEDYPWSSYRAFVGLDECPPWLHPEEILSFLPGGEEERQREYRDLVTGWKDGDPDQAARTYERRRAIGGEEFRRKWGDDDEEFADHAKETGLSDEPLIVVERPAVALVLQTVEDVFGCHGLFLRRGERPPHPARFAIVMIMRVLGWERREMGAAAGGVGTRTVGRYLEAGGILADRTDAEGLEFRTKVATCLLRLGHPIPADELPVAWRSAAAARPVRRKGAGG